jgi:chaperone modulatory protein CbpM
VNTSVSTITVAELCECEGISRSLLLQLVQYEIAEPMGGSSVDNWEFDTSSARWMQRAIRLQRDLDIDWLAVATLIDLLRERDALRRENNALRRRIGRFLSEDDR